MTTRNGTSGCARSSCRPISSTACSTGSSCAAGRSHQPVSCASSASLSCVIACTSAMKNSRSARGASSASSNSRTRSCHSQGLSCQRYSACSASLRASARAGVAAGVRFRLAHGAPISSQQLRHFQRRHPSPRRPCPCARGSRPLQRLLDVLRRQHAEMQLARRCRAPRRRCRAPPRPPRNRSARCRRGSRSPARRSHRSGRSRPACARPAAIRTHRARAAATSAAGIAALALPRSHGASRPCASTMSALKRAATTATRRPRALVAALAQ